MSKRLIIFIASCLAMCSLLSAQPVRIMDTLRRLEMENIAVRQRGDTVTVAFEPTPYRGVYRGIDAAIRGLAAIPELPTLQLVVLDHAVPQLCITLPSGLVKAYQVKECSLEDLYRTMDITVATRPAMRKLKGAPTFGRPNRPGVISGSDAGQQPSDQTIPLCGGTSAGFGNAALERRLDPCPGLSSVSQ